jgi:DNA-binding beta-propeller fold protein YncE
LGANRVKEGPLQTRGKFEGWHAGHIIALLTMPQSSPHFVMVSMGTAGAIAVNTYENRVNVVGGGGVQVINGATHTIGNTIALSRILRGMAADPTTGQMCVGDGFVGTLTRLTLASSRLRIVSDRLPHRYACALCAGCL